VKALSPTLRLYVTCIVSLTVPTLAFAAHQRPLSPVEVASAGILFGFAWIAQRFPIHLGPKLKVTVEDAATFAAALVLPPAIAMLLAGSSNLLGFRFNGKMPLYNRLFNAAAALLSTGGAALSFQLLRTDTRIAGDALAIIAAAAVAYLLRTELVDGAIALQLRRSPLAAWWLDHRRDIAQLGCLYALGGLAAIIAQDQPWALFLFVAPVGLILVSFRETIRLRSQTRAAILGLADLIDARDAYTFGHSMRVADYAERLARRFGMQPAQIELVREAARLHDVGKISTEDRILRKPGRLAPDEMAEMRKHCEHGYEFLKQLPEFWEGAELVRLHHERFDGTGYPRGIGGTELPQEASIISVADAWDAMTSDRPYRRALDAGQAKAELLRLRGAQWDPRVVDTFVAMLDEDRSLTTLPAIALGHPAQA
jgi:putative nucleotidyltransferase with HDIG domain